jgi:RNA polymerase sigma-70 factor (ECF subfamily)
MVEKTPETGRESASQMADAAMNASELKAWFVREVLPLEAILMHFLRHNWRDASEIEDLRQEVYARVCEAARKERPELAKPFVLQTARNLLIDRVRRGNVVPIDAVADLDALGVAMDAPGPDRAVIAREQLRRLQSALDKLSPRVRQVVVMRRIEGLARAEIASRMGITEDTVAEYLAQGMRVLANKLYGEAPPPGSTP